MSSFHDNIYNQSLLSINYNIFCLLIVCVEFFRIDLLIKQLTKDHRTAHLPETEEEGLFLYKRLNNYLQCHCKTSLYYTHKPPLHQHNQLPHKCFKVEKYLIIYKEIIDINNK